MSCSKKKHCFHLASDICYLRHLWQSDLTCKEGWGECERRSSYSFSILLEKSLDVWHPWRYFQSAVTPCHTLPSPRRQFGCFLARRMRRGEQAFGWTEGLLSCFGQMKSKTSSSVCPFPSNLSLRKPQAMRYERPRLNVRCYQLLVSFL